MNRLNILNSREIKKIKKLLRKAFNYSLEEDYAYLQNQKGKIFIINKELKRIDTNLIRTDKIGLYFAEVKNDQIRLSKEGAQLLFQEAEKNKKELKNVIFLNEKEVKDYFAGLDLEKDFGEENKLVLLQYQKNILGCAVYKQGRILNFMPKIHRREVIL